jgi:hypothetical protein
MTVGLILLKGGKNPHSLMKKLIKLFEEDNFTWEKEEFDLSHD